MRTLRKVAAFLTASSLLLSIAAPSSGTPGTPDEPVPSFAPVPDAGSSVGAVHSGPSPAGLPSLRDHMERAGVSVPDRPVIPIPTPPLIVEALIPPSRGLVSSGHDESGIASRMGSGFGRSYLALPEGPGHRVRICGDASCWTMTSTDAGPDLAMQRAGRVADLNDWVWHLVSGLPLSRGLCHVTVEYLS